MTQHLVRLSEAAFADIPNKVVPRTVRLQDPTFQGPSAATWIFSGYYNKLLAKNPGFQELLAQFSGRLDNPECRACITPGQHLLHTLTALDGEVRNGGLAQFFWNCPELILEVPEALEALELTELAQAYARALAGLTRKQDDWLELRKRASADPDAFWEPFRQSYDLLDLDWSDQAYFDHYGRAMVARINEYVRANRHAFIES